MILDFTLPAEREAHDPPEARGLARDGVRLLVSRRATEEVSHRAFRDLPGLLLPGDLVVVNDTGTLPAQVRAAGWPCTSPRLCPMVRGWWNCAR